MGLITAVTDVQDSTGATVVTPNPDGTRPALALKFTGATPTFAKNGDQGVVTVPVPTSSSLTLAGDVTGPANANTTAKIQGTPVSSSAPATNQALVYNGSAWAPGTVTTPYTTASTFTQPAPGATVNVTVGSSAWAGVGQYVTIFNGTTFAGDYLITAIPDATHLTLKDVNGLNRAATGSTIAGSSAAPVFPGNPHPRWVPYSTSTTKHAWFVDASNGTAILADLGTAGTNMTELGAAAYVLSPGPFGLCPDNRRVGTSISTVTNNAAFTAGAGEGALALPFTISTWIYVIYDNGGGSGSTHVNGGAFIYRSHDTTNDAGVPSFMLGLDSSKLTCSFYVGSGLVNVTAAEPFFNLPVSQGSNLYQWWHVGVSVDAGGNIKLYANGVIVGTGSLGGSIGWNTANPWVLFGRAASGDATATTLSAMRMADARVDTVAQTQAWFQSVYSSRYPGG